MPPKINEAFTQRLTEIVGNAAHAQRTQLDSNIPQELQNARPSTTRHFSFLRSMANFFAFLGNAIYAGIRSLGQVFTPSPTPPRPRLTLETVSTDTTRDKDFNYTLQRAVFDMDPSAIPADYLEYADNICAEISKEFSGFTINTVEKLCKEKKLRTKLENFIAEADGRVGKERFGDFVRECINYGTRFHALKEKIRQITSDRNDLPKDYHDSITFCLLGRLQNAYPELDAQIKNAKNENELTSLFNKQTTVNNKTVTLNDVINETITLYEEADKAPEVAKKELVGKLATFFKISDSETEKKAEIFLKKAMRKMSFLWPEIIQGIVQFPTNGILGKMREITNKIYDDITNTFSDIEKTNVSQQLKEKWKNMFLKTGKAYPKEIQLYTEFSRAAKKIDLSELIDSIRNNEPIEKIYNLINKAGHKTIENMRKENEIFASNYEKITYGVDDGLRFLKDLWDSILDEQPELNAIFLEKKTILTELLQLNSNKSNPSSYRSYDDSIIQQITNDMHMHTAFLKAMSEKIEAAQA